MWKLLQLVVVVTWWYATIIEAFSFEMPFSTKLKRRNVGGEGYLTQKYYGQTKMTTTTKTTKTELQMADLDDDSFMASLRSRMNEVNDRSTIIPLVVLDSMLPRQVIKIKVQNVLFQELVRTQLEAENPYFGMTGMARLQSGQQVHLKSGVEVEIIGKPEIDPNDNGLYLGLKAGRRFRILDDDDAVRTTEQGWTEAKVTFLNSEEEENKVKEDKSDNNTNTNTNNDNNNGKLSLNRAIQKAREFTSPNINMKDNVSLVDRWVQLATENERQPGQIKQLLQDLGEIPPPEEPSERAFWIGALVNPIPAMGVALEIRPKLLTSKSIEERVDVAYEGILKSIKHMDGSERLW